MMTSAQECAARILENWDRKRPLCILAATEDVRGVRAIVGATVPAESVCSGESWTLVEGSEVFVQAFTDSPFKRTGGYELALCNGGRELQSPDRAGMEKWLSASDAR